MRFIPSLLAAGLALPAAAQDCGGDFGPWLDGLKAEAVAQGVPAEAADAFLDGVRAHLEGRSAAETDSATDQDPANR